MATGLTEYAAIVAVIGTVIGSIVRPLCKWLTVRTLAAKARPEDLPKIAEALHSPLQLRPVRSRTASTCTAEDSRTSQQSGTAGSPPERP
ncbi:hypothetical protein [Amycolatopsis sp. NPDC054798]